MKHKTYSNCSSKNISVLITKLQAYLTRQCDLEIQNSRVGDDEYQIFAMTKHDILKRMIGLNMSIYIGMKKENRDVKVRVGNPAGPVGTGIFGAGSLHSIYNDVWTIIDNYFSQ